MRTELPERVLERRDEWTSIPWNDMFLFFIYFRCLEYNVQRFPGNEKIGKFKLCGIQ